MIAGKKRAIGEFWAYWNLGAAWAGFLWAVCVDFDRRRRKLSINSDVCRCKFVSHCRVSGGLMQNSFGGRKPQRLTCLL